MTPASDGVALVATHLALTDRRALSQAWYSALHLAQAERDGARAIVPVVPRASNARARGRSTPATAGAAAVRPNEPATKGSRERIDVTDRRHATSDLTRRIERAMTRLAPPVQKPRVQAQTIDIGNGRVRLLVRTDGRTTRIVALCAAPMRVHVERALAHTRFTLAAAGSVVVP